MTSPTHGAINLLIWTIVFTILDVIFVFLRFLAAHLTGRPLYADDYFIIFALMNTFALGGVIIWAVFASGMGHYSSELSPAELQNSLKIIPAAYVTWTLGTTAFKLSVLFLYTRLFGIKTFRYLSYTLMGITVAYCISFLVVFLTTCSPDISQLWNPRPDGHCRNLNVGQLGSVSTNLAIDCLTLILPMPFLWNLQMRLRNKIVVTVVFSFGLLTIGIMVWRIYDLVTTAGEDFVSNIPILALSTTLELWLCIIIACIPTLAPVFKTYFSPILTRLSGTRSTAGAHGTPLNIVTFGRLGNGTGPRRKNYRSMYESQDPTSDNLEAGRPHLKGETFPEEASTTIHVTSELDGGENMELRPIPVNNAIYVRREFHIRSTEEP